MAIKKKKSTKIEELTGAADKVASLWLEFRRGFFKALSSQEITRQEEQHFLELKSNLSRLQRILAQRLPEGVRYGSKKMTAIMGQAISIAALREMPHSDRKGIYQRWHDSYIALEHLQGILDVMEEGFPVKFESGPAKSGNIKRDLASDGAEKKGGAGKKVLVAAAVLVIAAVAYTYYK